MDNFIAKWHSDNKFRVKIKLLLYLIFFICVSAYAISYSHREIVPENVNPEKNEPINVNVLAIPEEYNYQISITIDDNKYEYNGTKTKEKTTIAKISDGITTNYLYENNNYYLDDNGIYIKTTKNEIYDIVNYNYISFDSIREYLNKATKNNNQYLVYLKNIILDDNSDEYFVMQVNDNDIGIDYTPLMKKLNSDLEKYIVSIHIEKID